MSSNAKNRGNHQKAADKAPVKEMSTINEVATANTVTPQQPQGFGRFRVKTGIHSEGGKVYGPGAPDGDIVLSASDLSKLGIDKFEPLDLK